MKVLYLAAPPNSPDGRTTATFIDEEIAELQRHGLTVYQIVFGQAVQEAEDPDLYSEVLPPGRSPLAVLRTLAFVWRVKHRIPLRAWLQPRRLYFTCRVECFAADLIFQHGIDLVHSNFGWPSGFGGILAKTRTGCPLIASFRGMDVLVDESLPYGLRRQIFYDRALRLLLKHADRTTHVSDFIKRRAIALGAVESTAVTVMKGVDCSRFCSLATARAAKNETPVILTVGGLIRRKGVDVILDALGRVAEAHDFEFHIAGDGPEQESLMLQARRVGIGGQTRFLGRVSRAEIASVFATADIFILASIWEASGNVLLEAMASGKPVITTDSGGPPEYVQDGECGFVVPVRDPETMANRIIRLLEDRELRERFGRRGRQRALEEFPYSRMIEDILAVYRSVLDH